MNYIFIEISKQKQKYMKKIILMITVVLGLALSTTAQTFTPYVNGGLSVSTNVLSYNGQIGASSEKSRYAATVSSVTAPKGNLWRVGAIGYWKLNKNEVASIFATGKAQMDLNRFHALTLTPGLAAIFNSKGALRPEINVGFPIRENSVFRNRPLGVEAGLGLNYSF